MNYAENIQSQIRKGTLEFAILLLVKKKEVYASEIIKELKDNNLIIVEGTLYPLLSRLKRNEVLEYTWKESKNGPPRKYYKLTKKGDETLKEIKKTWNSIYKSINLLNKNPKV